MTDEKWLDHHNAQYNVVEIITNLNQLGKHYIEDPCRECIGKHLIDIIADAREGYGLDDALEMREYLEAAESLAVGHLKEIIACTVSEDGRCTVKGREDLQRLFEETRKLRRELNLKIFGFSADLLYEGEQEGMRRELDEHARHELGVEHVHE